MNEIRAANRQRQTPTCDLALLNAIILLKRAGIPTDHLYGLTYSEYLMMQLIRIHTSGLKPGINGTVAPGVKISVVGKNLNISLPSASQMVQTLVNKGYIERITSARDRRVVYVRFTEDGAAVYDRAIASFAQLNLQLTAEIGEEAAADFIQVCDSIVSSLADISSRFMESQNQL